MKAINIIFIDDKLKQAFESLAEGKYKDRELYDSINKAIDKLKADPTCGIHIPKRLLPKDYDKYTLTNLWKYNLPKAWRLTYTIEADEIRILAIILEWMDHKNYERRFNY